MQITKQSQTGRYGKQGKATRKKSVGSKTEAPVQSACDDILVMKHIDYIRFPDGFWQYIHNPINKIKMYFKALCSKSFAGWADNTAFIPISDKYSLCVFIENKSRTGRFNGNEQRNKAKRLNYLVPRSPQEVAEVIKDFEDTAHMLKEYLKICNSLSQNKKQ